MPVNRIEFGAAPHNSVIDTFLLASRIKLIN
jgi:hypothetical protein